MDPLHPHIPVHRREPTDTHPRHGREIPGARGRVPRRLGLNPRHVSLRAGGGLRRASSRRPASPRRDSVHALLLRRHDARHGLGRSPGAVLVVVDSAGLRKQGKAGAAFNHLQTSAGMPDALKAAKYDCYGSRGGVQVWAAPRAARRSKMDTEEGGPDGGLEASHWWGSRKEAAARAPRSLTRVALRANRSESLRQFSRHARHVCSDAS